jgi:hypothetical protein
VVIIVQQYMQINSIFDSNRIYPDKYAPLLGVVSSDPPNAPQLWIKYFPLRR